ncbi:MAG: DegV family protein [Eubacterium sp.]|nr:DegV family protein [Eubacterium sp.]
MSRVAVMTDTNSGIPKERAEKLGIYLLPMSFLVNGKIYYEGIDLTYEEFFEKLQDPDTEVSTSQPAPGEVTDLWDEALKTHEQVVYIPMSSGLSASYQTAKMLADDYDGRVEVVNNQRISVTQYASVLDALNYAEAGMSAKEIREKLENDRFDSSIYIMVDTLKYLKKGGRITPAAALIGSVLNLKPVLQIQGEKLDSYSKSRGIKLAKKSMLNAIHHDLDTRFAEYVKAGTMTISYSYSYHANMDEVEEWADEIRKEFPGYEVNGDPLSLSICCHIGEGALAVTCENRPKV